MHYKKRRSRGYNQAEFIAEGYSNILKIPVKKEVIAKEKETTSQTRKNRFIRYQNAQNVFKIKDSTQLKQLRSILIIDDVITTGATIEALINCILTENPEIKLYVATLAAA
jgi:predicted amidophosphoribosyltransferase